MFSFKKRDVYLFKREREGTELESKEGEGGG